MTRQRIASSLVTRLVLAGLVLMTVGSTASYYQLTRFLREVATRLLGVVRQADTMARLGRDEFIVLAADLEHPAEVGLATLAHKCLQVLAQPCMRNGVEPELGGSIGVAWSGGASAPEQLLAAAAAAMYQAKQEGRGACAMTPALP